VWDYHLHVTPRYEGDEFYTLYESERSLMPADDRAEYARQLRAELQDWRSVAG
jgi:diadenosine tetraphosphate (Ap4A) HIT family hydrolase